MRIDTPNPRPRKDGEYRTYAGLGYGEPNGEIWLDEKGDLRLQNVAVADCDRLIKAAAAIKEELLVQHARMAAPHGRTNIYEGTCQLCGKPEDDELHDEMYDKAIRQAQYFAQPGNTIDDVLAEQAGR
jgi:hypothetical protein